MPSVSWFISGVVGTLGVRCAVGGMIGMSCCTCAVIGMVRMLSATRGSVSCGWRQVVCEWNGRYVTCYFDHA